MGVVAAGLQNANHPFLTAVISAPDNDGVRITGNVSAAIHAWLADHTVLGRTLFPGTGFVELAIRAGDEAGYPVLRELTLRAPLPLDRGAVQLHVVVGDEQQPGRRSIHLYARAATSEPGAWRLHAEGTVAQHSEIPDVLDDLAWPPRAQPVPLAGVYETLARRGYRYGPVFQGLNRLWRAGDDLYAEVRLPEGIGADDYGIHPALFDAALHSVLVGTADHTETSLPYEWTGVRLHATGATALRAHVAASGGHTYTVRLTDPAGQPVLTGALRTLPVTAEQLDSATTVTRPLHHMRWTPVASDRDPAVARTQPAQIIDLREFIQRIAEPQPEPPALLVVRCISAMDMDEDSAVLADVHAMAYQALDAVQKWLGDSRFRDARLVVETRRAVVAPGGPAEDLSGAAVWGLLGSAQTEHPDRIILIDTDRECDPTGYLVAGESKLVVRGDQVFAARIGVLDDGIPAAQDPFAVRLDSGTVVVTGGTGGLGAIAARHLVFAHGVRSLLLLSRRGPEAPGVDDLIAELTGAGARVRAISADTADRESLRRALTAIPGDAPLVGVVHAAGVLDDAAVTAQSPDRIDKVFAPKVAGAWHLHHLTAGAELAIFVLFSSVAGVLGSAGQANYAAANGFLDALASYRRARGLVATSIAWGLWEEATGMTGDLGFTGLNRLHRAGVAAMTREDALALLDQAMGSDIACPIAARWDIAELRTRAAENIQPPIFADLVPLARAIASPGVRTSALSSELAGLDGAQQYELVLEIVRTRAAAVLGHADAEEVAPGLAFKELGFDSLDSVAFRDRLTVATGIKLPAAVIFDYPTPRTLARYLVAEVTGVGQQQPASETFVPGADEPLAIVGMACRYPGAATTPDKLWEIVADGLDVTGDFPENRGWDTTQLYDPEPGAPGKTYARAGGFLYDAGEFDPDFFGITPREAIGMDPQQRLLLEVTWEALESSGIDPNSLHGTDTGVYTGMASPQGYGSPGYGIPATAASVASGRVSYLLGLEGPAVTVDTACSSSLVALHQAGLSLRAGECSMALVAGVTVMATPEVFVEFSLQGGLSPDGRCRSFAGTADGTGWAEGVGVLVVERLSDAVRNGHEVLAVVRGSAVNQDGASNGLTAPNGPSQQRVIRQALNNAQLSVTDVDVVEAHGTGTRLGDPIEAQALLATYGQRESGEPLWLGSIKSNMGHTQAAAGIAGIIKMIQAMRHGVMPKTLHVDEPTPHVDWSAGHVELLTEAREWPERGRPRRAGVSSFGISGTNAHVILEQAPAVEAVSERVVPPVIPWVVSARSREALVAQVSRLREFVQGRPELDPVDVGWSLTGRSVFEHRMVALGRDRDELLASLSAGELGDSGGSPGRVVFVFPGQGSQWVGMGRELYDSYPVFARAWDAIEERIDIDLRAALWESDTDTVDRTRFAQAGLFAVGVALFRLLESWGVTPDAVIGHSVGEIAAAHVAGVLSLDDAVSLVATRGRLMQALPVGGAMAAVAVSEAEMGSLIESAGIDVDIAAVNGPRAVVVSGSADAVEQIARTAAERGLRVRRLRVSHAFHSELMQPMLEQFATEIAGIDAAAPTIPIISNVTGEFADTGFGTTAYWVRHIREAVRFGAGIVALRRWKASRFIEIGPGSGLAAEISAAAEDALVLSALRRQSLEADALLDGLRRLFVSGCAVDWRQLTGNSTARPIPVPTYAFQHSNYWLPPARSADSAEPGGLSMVDHPLLGGFADNPGTSEAIMTGLLSPRRQPWLSDHALFGRTLLPGAAFIEIAARAGLEVGCDLVQELTLSAPLPIDRGDIHLRVVVGSAGNDKRRSVAIYSRPDDGADEWRHHAEGTLAATNASATGSWAWPSEAAQILNVPEVYGWLAERGYEYGPAFHGLRVVSRHEDVVYVEAVLPEGTDAAGYLLHPALLDAVLHAILLTADPAGGSLSMPFSWSEVAVFRSGATRVRARITAAGDDTVCVDVVDESDQPVLRIGTLRSRPVSEAQLTNVAKPELFGVSWVPWDPAVSVAIGTVGTVAVQELSAFRARDVHVPDVVVAQCAAGVGEPLAATYGSAHETLRAVQAWLSDPRCAESRLILVTRNAIDPEGGAAVSLPDATVWGLIGTAQVEYPGRLGLVDLEYDAELDVSAIAGCGEPQAVLRDHRLLVPRFERLADPVAPAPELESGTVLVTGGTTGVGALVARHLVRHHQVRSLMLVSRRGAAAPEADALIAELSMTGARVAAVAADVADRESLHRALAAIPEDAPLVGIVHAAGVLADAVFAAQSAAHIDAVFAPKVDGAWHLHELTADRHLELFVMFSSVAGVLGAAGQSNYSAANRFLDALASFRRSRGLPAKSIGWGLWGDRTGMTGRLRATDLDRLRGAGLLPMPQNQALDLFDRAMRTPESVAVAGAWDRAALRRQAVDNTLPPILSGIAPPPPATALQPARHEARDLRTRLSGLDPEHQREAVAELVRRHAAAALGRAGTTGIDPEQAFTDLGFDSLSAVELRNRLSQATGLKLPAHLIFDQPTPEALSRYLQPLLTGVFAAADRTVDELLDQLEAALARSGGPDGGGAHVLDRLRALAARGIGAAQHARNGHHDIESATGDELFAIIDREL
ncbi:SDR family NAD(P)-dependent oxidoreductase [Nocardia sp. NPDC048505]|uniref:SDR family NAD(P)-dependent oxidoreductase n=1 Tax=Nocardia sp. NPDC048505 TaxID=3155756 RepID=UPI0033CA3D67